MLLLFSEGFSFQHALILEHNFSVLVLKANNAEKVFFSTNRFLPWEILLVKKLEIEKTKPTFIISVLKVVY